MAVCLVTGGAGFIGSHLVGALVTHGHAVRVLDNFSTGRRANLEAVAGKIDLVVGDLTDAATIRAATEGVELVFHLAAQASPFSSRSDPLAAHHACATGTLQVLLAAREAGVRRVVYAGSANVYGDSKKLPRREGDPTRPLSPYAVAKLAGEQYCELFSQAFGLETVRLRYFNVFGPRQPEDGPDGSVVPVFLQALLAGRRPVVFGDGLQSRDFTYVEDVVQANLLAADARRVSGKVYNVAFGQPTTLLDLAACLNELLGTRLKPVHGKPRPGDVRHSYADTTLAQKELGYCPFVSLKEGLRRCLEFLSARPAAPGEPVDPPGGPFPRPHLTLSGAEAAKVPSDL